MITSRCLTLARLSSNGVTNLLLLSCKNNQNNQIIRYSHATEYHYRRIPQWNNKKELIGSEIVGGIIWWWVLWNILSNPKELIGHSYPDPSKWTDEELGIPPENE